MSSSGDDNRTTTEARSSTTPWQTIAKAVAEASTGDTVQVLAGSYNESVLVNKSLAIIGAGASSTTITGNGTQNAVFVVSSPNVSISGFTIDVDQANTLYGIRSQGTTVSGLRVTDNFINSAAPSGGFRCLQFSTMGIYLNNIGTSSYTIARNYIGPKTQNDQNCIFGRAIRVTGGTGMIGGMTDADSNVLAANYSIQIGSARGATTISHNHLFGIGVQFVGPNANSGNHIISANRFEPGLSFLVQVLAEIRAVTNTGTSITVDANQFSDFSFGGVVSQRSNNVTVSNNVFTPRDTTTYASIVVNTKQVTSAATATQTSFVNGISIVGNTFNGASNHPNSGTAIGFANHNNNSSFAPITIGGAGALANIFKESVGTFIRMDTSSGPTAGSAFYPTENPNASTFMSPAAPSVDATQNIFGVTGQELLPAAMSPAQLFALEDNIIHGIDVASLGFVTVVPNAAYVTPNSFLAPATTVASIQRALDKAPLNSTVYAAQAVYTENLNINRAVSLAGTSAGRPVINGGAASSVILVSVPNVTISGLTLQVNQGTTLYGITTQGTNVGGLTVTDNQILSSAPSGGTQCLQFNSMGIYLNNIGTSSYTIARNYIGPESFTGQTCVFGRAIRVTGGAGTIGGMAAADSNLLAAYYSIQIGSARGTTIVSNNHAIGIGLQFVGPSANSGNHLVSNNRFEPGISYLVPQLVELRAVTSAGTSVTFDNNQFNDFSFVGLSSQRSNNVTVSNNTFTPRDTTTYTAISVNTKQVTGAATATQTSFVNGISIIGNTFNGAPSNLTSGTGILFANHNNNSSFAPITIGGPGVLANTFKQGLGTFVRMDTSNGPTAGSRFYPTEAPTSSTFMSPANATVDASQNIYGVQGQELAPSAMSAEQLFALEDKLTHKIDASTLGFVTVVANAAYVTPNSFVAPLTTTGSIQRGIDAAALNGQVLVAPGVFTENLNVNRSVSVLGTSAGRPVVNGNATANLVTVSAPNVTLSGLSLVVSQDVTDVGVRVNGTNANNLTITDNNILSAGAGFNCFQSGTYGIYLSGLGTTSYNISRNRILPATLDRQSCVFSRGILISGGHGTIGGATVADSNIIAGLYAVDITNATGGQVAVSNNRLGAFGLRFVNPAANSGTHLVSNNRFELLEYQYVISNLLELRSVLNAGTGVSITGNSFSNFGQAGIFSSRSRNISISNNVFNPYDTVTAEAIVINTKQSTSANASTQTAQVNSASITGNTFNAPATAGTGKAIAFYNHNSTGTFGNVVIGGQGQENNFSSNLAVYVYQDTATGFSRAFNPWRQEAVNAITPVVPAVVNADISNNAVDGLSVSAMTTAQRYAYTDKVWDAIDWSALGYLSVQPTNAFVSNNAFIAPKTTAPSLARALTQIPNGGSITYAGSSYTSDVLTVNKSATLLPDASQATTIGTITMAGAGNVLTLNSNVNIANQVSLNGGGIINPRTHTLTVLPTASMDAGNANGYVLVNEGAVAKEGAGAGVTNFAIGTAAGYFPLSINDNNNTGDTWTVRAAARSSVGNFVPPLFPTATAFVGNQWNITEATPGGSNASVTVGWPTNSVVGGPFNPTQSYVTVLNQSGWNVQPAASAVSGTATFSGATSFSSVAVYGENRIIGTVYYVADTGDNNRTAAQAQIRTSPWQTLAHAVANVADGDTIMVISGTFPENIIINKQIAIIGETHSGVKPTVNGNATEAVFTVSARNVTVRNLNIEVDQITTLHGIYAPNSGYNGLSITDNNILSALPSSTSPMVFGSYGVRLIGGGSDGIVVARNIIAPKNSSSSVFGRAVRTVGGWGYIGGISKADSNFTFSFYGVQSGDVKGGPLYVVNNHLHFRGVEINTPAANSGGSVVRGNVIDIPVASDSIFAAIELKNAVNANATVVVDSNVINNYGIYGISAGHSNQIEIRNNTLTPSVTAFQPRAIAINTKVETIQPDMPPVVTNAIITGNRINGNSANNTIGIDIANHDNLSSLGNYVIGGDGALANHFGAGLKYAIALDTLSGTTVRHYLWRALSGVAVTLATPANTNVDATKNLFDLGAGAKLPAAMTNAELIALEAKTLHKTHFDQLGFVTYKPNNAFVSNASFIAPFTTTSSVQRALDAIDPQVGDNVVTTEANAYAEAVTGRNATVQTLNGETLTLNSITMSSEQDTLGLGVRTVVTNGVTLTDGYIDASAHSLVVPTGATVTGGDENSFVVAGSTTGGFVQQGVGTSTVNFPVGVIGRGYYPVSLTDANNTGDSVTVRAAGVNTVTGFAAPLPNGVTRFVNAQWTILKGTAGSSNATLTFGWPANAELGGPLSNTGSVIARYDGTRWEERFSTLGTRSITASGFTSFSPFAVYDNNITAGKRYYVDATRGDDGRSNNEATNPNTPWRTITTATNRTLDGDTVVVFSGVYNENPIIRRQSVYMGGVFDAGNVVLPPAAQALALANKPVVNGNGDGSDSSSVFKVRSTAVTIQNFAIGVNQQSTMNGIWANRSRINGLTIADNAIVGTAPGSGSVGLTFNSNAIYLESAPAGDMVTVKRNYVAPQNLTNGQAFGRAIRIEGASAVIGGETLADSNLFLSYYGVDAVGTANGSVVVKNNSLTGIGASMIYQGVNSRHEVVKNRFFQYVPGVIPASVQVRYNIRPTSVVRIDSNQILNHNYFGVSVMHSSNVSISNNTFVPVDTARSFTHIEVNTKLETGGSTANLTRIFSDVSISNNDFGVAGTAQGTGILFSNHDNRNRFRNVTVTGNNFAAGLNAFVVQDTARGFSAQNPRWQGEDPLAITTMSPANINADLSNNTYGVTGGSLQPSAMSVAQLYEVEDKLRHAIDYDSLGFFNVVPNRAYVTGNSFVAPLTTAPSLQRAHNVLVDGDQILTNQHLTTATSEVVNLTKSLTVDANPDGVLAIGGLTLNTNGGTLTLADQTRLSVGLNFAANGGRVLIGNNQLNLGAAAGITGGDANAYVVTTGSGVLTHASLPAASVTFPIGTAADYAPVTVSDAVASGDSVAFSVAPAANAVAFTPSLPGNAIRFPRLQWRIGEGNRGTNNATLTFAWPASSVFNGPLSATNTVLATSNLVNWAPRPTALGVNSATTAGYTSLANGYAVYSTDQLSGTKYYVDSLIGDDARPNVVATNPNTPWRSITNAINLTVDGDTIVVRTDGSYGYNQSLLINKQLTLIGNDSNRTVKPVINGTSNAAVIRVAARNVTIDNFEVRVDQSTVTRGIEAPAAGVNNLTITNNRILTYNHLRASSPVVFGSYGIFLNLGSATDYFTISRNVIAFQSNSSAVFGRGIRTIGGYGVVGGATLADSNQSVGLYGLQVANSNGGSLNVRNNHLYLQGMEINTPIAATNHIISNNKFEAGAPEAVLALMEVKSNVTPGANIIVDSNQFLGHGYYGVFSTRSNNVTISNNTFVPADTANFFNHIHVNSKQRTSATSEPAFTNGVTITGNTFAGASTGRGYGVFFGNADNTAGAATWGTVTVGGAGNLANNFDGRLGKYIGYDFNNGQSNTFFPFTGSGLAVTVASPADFRLDGSANNYTVSAGLKAPATMTRAELFELEAKYQHKTGLSSIGFVTVVPNTVFVSNSSFVTPVTTIASVQRGVDAALATNTVIVQPASVAENVTVNKAVTLESEGVTTTVNLNGITMNGAGDLTLNSPVAVSNSLTLTAGNIVLGGNNLTAGATATMGAGSAVSHVVTNGNGRLVKDGVGLTPVTYPVGTGAQYTPVTFADANQTNDAIGVLVRPGRTAATFTSPLPVSATAFVNVEYDITEAVPGGSSPDLTFGWNPTANESAPVNTFTRILNLASGNWVRYSTNYNVVTPGVLANATAQINNLGQFAVVSDATPFALATEVRTKTAARPTAFCPGDSVLIVAQTTDQFLAGNQFNAELSDATGSFATPTVIGTVTATGRDTIRTIIPVAAVPGTGYRIRVVSTNPAFTATDNGDALTINTLPAQPTITSGATTFCAGDSLQLNAPAGFTTYVWSNGASTQSIFVKVAGNYTVSVGNGNCNSVPSAPVAVTVTPRPDATFTGLAATICVNAPAVTLTPATAGGTFTGTGVTGTTFNPATAGVGTFRIRYSVSANGCSDTSGVTVTVTPAPVATFTGLPANACVNGGAITLTPTTTGGTFFVNGVAQAGNTFTPTATGSFRVRYELTVGGCTDTTGQTVVVNPLPNASFTGAAGPYCAGSPVVTITPTTAGGTLFVNGVAQAGLTFNPTTAGTFRLRYSVTINGCTDTTGQTVVVNPLPNATFTGLPATLCVGAGAVTLTPTTTGGTFSGTGVTGSTFNPTVAGTFRVRYTVTVNGCTDTTGQTVVVSPRPNAGFTASSNALCSGETATFTPATAGGTFFLNGVAQAGNSINFATAGSFRVRYSVTVGGCTDTTGQLVVVNAKPTATFTAPAAVCAGAEISVVPTTTGGTFYLNNVAVTLPITAPATGTSATVKYVLSNTSGCRDSVEVVVALNAAPDASFTAPAQACENQAITFTPAVAGGTFTVNGTAITGNTFTPTATGTLTVTYTVSNTTGCTSTSAPFSITVTPSNLTLAVNITGGESVVGDTVIATEGARVSFTASGTPAGGTFTWTGPGVSQTGATLGVDVTAPAVYTVTYQVGGCTVSRNVTVKIAREIFIPNFISPNSANGDVNNRKLHVFGFGISPDGFSFTIFNRYGNQVYSTSNLNDLTYPNGWDAAGLPTDTYNYVIKGKLTNGQDLKVEGRNTGSVYVQK